MTSLQTVYPHTGEGLSTGISGRVLIAPLQAGAGFIVVFQVRRSSGVGSALLHPSFRIVTLKVDANFRSPSTLFESDWRDEETLIDAVPVEGGCVILGWERDPNRVGARYWLRRVTPNGASAASYFLEGHAAGSGPRFVPICMGGRLTAPSWFLVVARTSLELGPDTFVDTLWALKVDLDALAITGQLQLPVTGPTSLVACSRVASASTDGWMIAVGGLGSGVSLARVSVGFGVFGPYPLNAGPPGSTLVELAIAGGARESAPGGLLQCTYCVATVYVDGTGARSAACVSFCLDVAGRSMRLGAGPYRYRLCLLGPTFASIRLAADRGTHSHWLLVHEVPPVGGGAATTVLCRIGIPTGIYQHNEHIRGIGSASAIGVEYDGASDQVVLAFESYDVHPTGLMMLGFPRFRPRALPLGSAACGRIGSRYPRPESPPLPDLVNVPVPGHAFFTVTLDGGPPLQEVELLVAPRLATVPSSSCTEIVDMTDAAAQRFRCTTNATGVATLVLPLARAGGEYLGFNNFFSLGSNGVIGDIPPILFAQWHWRQLEFHSVPGVPEPGVPAIVERWSSSLVLVLGG